MQNPALTFLTSQIGKDAQKSPSPLMRWLNPTLLSVAEGSLSMRFEVRPEWLNPMQQLHGGIVAAIMDDAIGATVFSLGETHFFATVSNQIDYFGRAGLGETIEARAEIVKRGRQLIHAQCTLWNADGSRMLAKGSSNLLKTELQK